MSVTRVFGFSSGVCGLCVLRICMSVSVLWVCCMYMPVYIRMEYIWCVCVNVKCVY